jgi:hypothetical protein
MNSRVDEWKGGRAINVGEEEAAAATGTAVVGMGCQKSWSVFSVGGAVFLLRSIF